MGLTLTNFGPFIKTLWPQSRVENLTFQNQPFLAMVPKMTKFYGDSAVLALQYGDTQGRSAVFATAQANKGNLSAKKFVVTRVKDYALASVDGETIEATQNNEGALAKAWDREVASAVHSLKRSLGTSLFRSGSGSIGQSSSTSSPVTLVNIRDIVNFEVGMNISAGPNDSSTSLRSGTGLITAIDRDAGTITYTGTITSLTANDYLFVQGDASAKISGLAAWVPSTAPSSTSFFGVDRTSDVVRLGGKRIDISTYSPSEGLVKAANSLGMEGGAPTHLFMHYDQFTNVEHDLGAKVQYEDLSVGEVGFRALLINGPTGPIKVIPDINCPYGYSYLLQMDTWELMSLGELPRFLDFDGLKMLREASSDGYEVRLGYYAQLACTAPGWNAVLTMP